MSVNHLSDWKSASKFAAGQASRGVRRPVRGLTVKQVPSGLHAGAVVDLDGGPRRPVREDIAQKDKSLAAAGRAAEKLGPCGARLGNYTEPDVMPQFYGSTAGFAHTIGAWSIRSSIFGRLWRASRYATCDGWSAAVIAACRPTGTRASTGMRMGHACVAKLSVC